MSRSRLSLFALDRGALDAFSTELRAALTADDRDALARLLALEGDAAEPLRGAAHAVDLLLASESHAPSAALFVALRRATRDRALRRAWASESLALEGRLRGFEPLREDAELARRVDALLDGAGIPWFLRGVGSTCGSVGGGDRAVIAERMAELDDPPPELVAFAEALGALDGDVLAHDTL